jgi:hypothetical protein
MSSKFQKKASGKNISKLVEDQIVFCDAACMVTQAMSWRTSLDGPVPDEDGACSGSVGLRFLTGGANSCTCQVLTFSLGIGADDSSQLTCKRRGKFIILVNLKLQRAKFMWQLQAYQVCGNSKRVVFCDSYIKQVLT